MVSNTLVFINCILRVGRDGSSSGDKHVTERVVWALICLAALIFSIWILFKKGCFLFAEMSQFLLWLLKFEITIAVLFFSNLMNHNKNNNMQPKFMDFWINWHIWLGKSKIKFVKNDKKQKFEIHQNKSLEKVCIFLHSKHMWQSKH